MHICSVRDGFSSRHNAHSATISSSQLTELAFSSARKQILSAAPAHLTGVVGNVNTALPDASRSIVGQTFVTYFGEYSEITLESLSANASLLPFICHRHTHPLTACSFNVSTRIHTSHTRTVVRECFKGDEASPWKRP